MSQFSHDFLLRSVICLKERPPSVSIGNREFPLSIQLEDVVRLHGLNTLQSVNYTAAPWFTLQYKVLSPRTICCFVCFVVNSIDACNVSPPPCLNLHHPWAFYRETTVINCLYYLYYMVPQWHEKIERFIGNFVTVYVIQFLCISLK